MKFNLKRSVITNVVILAIATFGALFVAEEATRQKQFLMATYHISDSAMMDSAALGALKKAGITSPKLELLDVRHRLLTRRHQQYLWDIQQSSALEILMAYGEHRKRRQDLFWERAELSEGIDTWNEPDWWHRYR